MSLVRRHAPWGAWGQGTGLDDGRGVGALDQPEGCWISLCHGICLQGAPNGARELPLTPSNQILPHALLRPQQVWAQHNGNVAGGHFIHLLVFSQLG